MWSGSAYGLYWMGYGDRNGPRPKVRFAELRRMVAYLRPYLWMTAGVLWAIHWEALFIWLKGERIRTRPKTPEWAVTVVTPAKLAA